MWWNNYTGVAIGWDTKPKEDRSMGLRIEYEAFYASPTGHRVYYNLETRIVGIFSRAQRILTVTIQRLKSELIILPKTDYSQWLTTRVDLLYPGRCVVI
jgi:hypothetical protein